MTIRRLVCILTVCAAATGLAVTGASAAPCKGAHCKPEARSSQAKPLTLTKFMRKPVTAAATRTVKKMDGQYANVAIKRRSKRQPAALHAAAPQVAPETISPAAAQAFASYELARVRVVTPGDDNGPALMTDSTAVASNTETVVNVETVQVVSAEQVNDIDRQADAPRAVSLDTLTRSLAASNGEPKAEGNSWFQQMLLMIGGAFAAAAAMVRAVFG